MMGIGLLLLLAVCGLPDIQARLPPKFLKVAAGAGKALYARGYGYSVIPIPHKILLQSNFDRKEVHHRVRPKRGRPRRRLPPHFAAGYQKYRPSRKPRPPPVKEPPDYREEELEEELDYDEKPYKDFEDFVTKHSELYAEGYNAEGKKKEKYKDEDGVYAENSEQIFIRKPRPKLKDTKGPRVASTKLYSATISYSPPPIKLREEEEEETLELEDEEVFGKRKEPKKSRIRQRNQPPKYRQENSNLKGNSRYNERQPIKDWDPDDIYHDRNEPYKKHLPKRTLDDKLLNHSELRDRWRQPVPYRWKTSTQNTIWNVHSDPERDWDDEREKRLRNDYSVQKDVLRPPYIEKFARNSYSQYQKDSRSQNARWRNQDLVHGRKQLKRNEGQFVPDIITSQNAEHWKEDEEEKGIHRYNPIQKTTTEETWVKEHSVGYGIEIGGGDVKRKDATDPDVIYGELREEMKPRVPDIGYNEGLMNRSRSGRYSELLYERYQK